MASRARPGSSGAGGSSGQPSQRPSRKVTKEDAFLLQMPEHLAPLLRTASEKEVDLEFIGTEQDGAQDATLSIKGRVLPARLMRLPTIVETHKSLDGVLYYKHGHVHQAPASPCMLFMCRWLRACCCGVVASGPVPSMRFRRLETVSRSLPSPAWKAARNVPSKAAPTSLFPQSRFESCKERPSESQLRLLPLRKLEGPFFRRQRPSSPLPLGKLQGTFLRRQRPTSPASKAGGKALSKAASAFSGFPPGPRRRRDPRRAAARRRARRRAHAAHGGHPAAQVAQAVAARPARSSAGRACCRLVPSVGSPLWVCALSDLCKDLLPIPKFPTLDSPLWACASLSDPCQDLPSIRPLIHLGLASLGGCFVRSV